MSQKVATHSVHDLGNSFGIVIPKPWCKKNGIKDKTKLDIYVSGKNIIIKPPKN